MKKTFAALFAVLAISAFTSALASAQEFSTTYFLDNNLYPYRINPAIPGEKGFVGVAVGNVNLAFGSNIGISSLLYKKPDGSLMTGFHSSVSADTFLGNLKQNNRIDQVFNENLLAVGFWTKKAFHSIEINVKEDVFVGLPKDLFTLLKTGDSDYPYDLSQTNASIKSYAELAYGYTGRINDKWSLGGRVKFLMGLASGQAGFEQGTMTLNASEVSYNVLAKFRMSSNFIDIGKKTEDASIFDFSAFRMDISKLTPCGFGGAIDLGVTFKPVKGLVLSFSVLDLGGIWWKYNIVGVSSGNDIFTGETIKSDGTVKGDLQAFYDKLTKLSEFSTVEGGESSFEMIACTLNLGARYYMPFYERLSVGLLVTSRLDKYNSSVGGRLGLTVTPVDWLSITGNYGINTYCATYGAAISLNGGNINFMFGYEGYSGAVSNVRYTHTLMPLATPINSFQNMVKAGINITFGARHNDFKPISNHWIHGKRAETVGAGTTGAANAQGSVTAPSANAGTTGAATVAAQP